MPPKEIDVPAKGVDGAIWLRHRHYCLALSVLKRSVPEVLEVGIQFRIL